MKIVLIALALLFSAQVYAGEPVTVSWVAPTENTDGSAITQLDGFAIYYTDSTGTDFVVPVTDGTAVEYIIPDVALGPAQFYMTATAGGVESAPSTTIDHTVVVKSQGVPVAPVILGIT